MKISRNVMQMYGGQSLDASAVELAARIGSQLGAVEEIIETGPRYDNIVIARVMSCVKHPDADRLHVCMIDDGGITGDVARDDQGYVKIVCGAPNVREGLLVAWLPPGITVPSTIDKEPFVLETREIRGVVSNGMLGSAKELALSDDHDGILEIKVQEVGEELAKPGTPFKKLYGLDDIIIEVENKMFTHRPDCFGQLGVAREISGIYSKPFHSPAWYQQPDPPANNQSDHIKQFGVTNEVPDLCPRYMLAAVDNVKIAPSPTWLQAFLSRIGVRPINNIVDMTNYIMLLTGQPLHAFDFDKVARDGNAQIVVRKPRAGEKLTLLDGKTITPRTEAILICDQDKPIALGGMMGGNNSEIDENTTRILIECATFDMYNIRRTSMEHGIFTDAVTRFTKGQSPLQCPAVLYKALQMTQELCPGALPIGEPKDFFQGSVQLNYLEVSTDFINERLGLTLTADDMAILLKNVEFSVDVKDSVLSVTAPFWRTDIEIAEDVVEEVGRLYGYDHLPLVLPKRNLSPAPQNDLLTLKSRLRASLSRAGANEVLTYSFVHGDLLTKTGQQVNQAFKLSNAQSPDLQYFRLSLTPSLLDKVHSNLRAGYDEFALFEIGKSHIKQMVERTESDLPHEFSSLSLVVVADDKAAQKHQGAAYYRAKKYLDYLLQEWRLNNEIQLKPLTGLDLGSSPYIQQLVAPFAVERSAILQDTEDIILGVVGELSDNTRRAHKLPTYTAAFEIGLLPFLRKAGSEATYRSLPRFPKVEQDMTLKVPGRITYRALLDLLRSELEKAKPENTMVIFSPISIFQKDEAFKNYSFRLEIASYDRTMTAEEVNRLLDIVAQSAHDALDAIRI